jgi:hypothetical protein
MVTVPFLGRELAKSINGFKDVAAASASRSGLTNRMLRLVMGYESRPPPPTLGHPAIRVGGQDPKKVLHLGFVRTVEIYLCVLVTGLC